MDDDLPSPMGCGDRRRDETSMEAARIAAALHRAEPVRFGANSTKFDNSDQTMRRFRHHLS
jgi:hypothetical protein